MRNANEDFQEGRVIDGVFRWHSNDAVPFNDVLDELVNSGLITSDVRDASVIAREADTAKFLASYRANPPQPSAEELSEMRAAFGEGETVVDVFTGRKIQL